MFDVQQGAAGQVSQRQVVTVTTLSAHAAPAPVAQAAPAPVAQAAPAPVAQAAPAPVAQAAPAPPTPPAPPALPGAQGGPGSAVAPTPQLPVVPGTAADLTGYTASQLRRILSELRNQRQDLADRRQTISGQYENATGANRDGIGERLRVLDGNIVGYEAEIARVGKQLALKGGETSTGQPGSGAVPNGYVSEDDMAGAIFGTFLATALVVAFLTRRFMRRRYGRMPQAAPLQLAQSTERLDRIEQAVDSIAIEIERVSENQRFMTRLMTETQLGATINDVRRSAELAKAASEAPSE